MAEFFTSLAEAGQNLKNVVLVVDNAPVHSDIERVACKAMILRLALYSVPLNPIKSAWSQIKSQIKQTFAENFPKMILEEDREIGENQTTYRLRVLEKHIDDALTVVTPMNAIRYVNHVMKHYPACMT